MGFFNKEVELIIPPKKQNSKTIKVKSSLNGYNAIKPILNNSIYIYIVWDSLKTLS